MPKVIVLSLPLSENIHKNKSIGKPFLSHPIKIDPTFHPFTPGMLSTLQRGNGIWVMPKIHCVCNFITLEIRERKNSRQVSKTPTDIYSRKTNIPEWEFQFQPKQLRKYFHFRPLLTLTPSHLSPLCMVSTEALKMNHTAFFVQVQSHYLNTNCPHCLGGFSSSCYEFALCCVLIQHHLEEVLGEEDN